MQITLVADPSTGLVWESPELYRDATYAFEQRNRQGFKLLTDKTRAIVLPGGCTIGEEAAWMMPGENLSTDGTVVQVSG